RRAAAHAPPGGRGAGSRGPDRPPHADGCRRRAFGTRPRDGNRTRGRPPAARRGGRRPTVSAGGRPEGGSAVSVARSPEIDRAIVRTLAEVVTSALAPGAGARAWSAARDAAQLLSLEGLDRVLAACEPYVGRPFPAEIAPLADRLARLAAQARD